MKVLFLSNLYPNSQDLGRATFNRQKIARLKNSCEVVVVAPIQWFPFKWVFDKKISKIPAEEIIDGLTIYHPRIFYIPKLFRLSYGWLYYLSIRSFIKKLDNQYNFDVIYASWVYPDGFAAMKSAGLLDKPFIVEALGSDINIYSKTFFRRRIISRVLSCVDKIVAVSEDLKKEIVKLGVLEEKIEVIYSGIDHSLFSPLEKEQAREALGLTYKGKIIVCIGNLVKIKGVQFLLEALTKLKLLDYKLFIVGKGRLEKYLRQRIESLGLQERVEMIGAIPHEKVPLWMNACDLLCLPSLSEGVPNVILEAFACGIPVVANKVGGVPEVISDERAGLMTVAANPKELAISVDDALRKTWDRGYIRSQALRFSWENNSRELFNLLRSACASN